MGLVSMLCSGSTAGAQHDPAAARTPSPEAPAADAPARNAEEARGQGPSSAGLATEGPTSPQPDVEAEERAGPVARGHTGSVDVSADQLLERAEHQLKAKAFEAAAQTLARLVELRPDDAELQRKLGYSRLGASDLKGAVAPLREAARLRPDEPMHWLLLGNAYRLSDQDKARAAFRRALELDPDNTTAREALLELDARSARAEAREAAGHVEPARPSINVLLVPPAILGAVAFASIGALCASAAFAAQEEPDCFYTGVPLLTLIGVAVGAVIGAVLYGAMWLGSSGPRRGVAPPPTVARGGGRAMETLRLAF